MSTLALLLMGGMALADRGGRGGRGGGGGGGRVVVRDHRGGGGGYSSVRVRDSGPSRRVVQRRPVYVSGGRYVFGNGVVRTYRRPVITTHYYDYRVRPQIIVESYDPVPGYVWVNGSWRWSGREWIWASGYFAVDPSVTIYAEF
ncbi:MAG TPA: hypothetical protein VFQ53_00560 [Kofleriaceae bacterium]|nr:hypothetical protein [Kofleriaceae bacterium]